MVVGCFVNIRAWQYKKNGEFCQVTDENLKVSFVMYGTYFLLFAQFFLGSYIYKSSTGKSRKEETIKKID